VDQIAVEAWRLMFHQISGRPIANPHIRAAGQLIIRRSTAARAESGKKLGVM
jgi:DNA-binding LacI/PurR family transcriptional regulator